MDGGQEGSQPGEDEIQKGIQEEVPENTKKGFFQRIKDRFNNGPKAEGPDDLDYVHNSSPKAERPDDLNSDYYKRQQERAAKRDNPQELPEIKNSTTNASNEFLNSIANRPSTLQRELQAKAERLKGMKVGSSFGNLPSDELPFGRDSITTLALLNAAAVLNQQS